MVFLKRLLVVVSLSVGTVATVTSLPVAAQNTTHRDAENLIDSQIALLSREIVQATSVLDDPASSPPEKDEAADLVTQNSVRIAVLQGTKAVFANRWRPTFQIPQEYFPSIAGPHMPYPDGY